MREYTISTASSRFSTSWPRKIVSWDDFLGKLEKPERGAETQKEYFSLPKSKQDELKDVGGFVAGTLEGDRRKVNLVEGRDMITLDMDSIPSGDTDAVLNKVSMLGCAAAVYSTRKHTPNKPRLRVIVPLDRTAAPDEYEPAARKLASLIGIGMCDPTTFQAVRLMYWPSCSKDGEYVFQSFKGSECRLDSLLRMYQDWHDVSTWPVVPGEAEVIARKGKTQEDPESKRGIVGAFCRTYDIYTAIDTFLPGIYEDAGNDRLTFVGGSTSGGAIVYDNKFLYSHHATDPCSGFLVNAFDLVRIHKFADRDVDVTADAKPSSTPSYKEMVKLAKTDKAVIATLGEEEDERLREAFQAPEVVNDEYNPEWKSDLQISDSGERKGTIENVCLIIRNDMNLRGKIWLDKFAERIMVNAPVPWSSTEPEGVRPWTDTDDAGLYWYIERFYIEKIPQAKILAGTNLEASRNGVDPVREYLRSLKWDGVNRLDEIIIRYLGADDNKYVRTVTKKFMVAAVARVMQPGVKFDNMVILVGAQGIGKSTLFRKLGGPWFSDSLTSFEGKDASDLIQGRWIVEVGELTAMTRQESNSVKQFLSKQDDQYRAAYGRRTEKHPRRCIFVGTSNDDEFLKDTTGNRRFWPIEVRESEAGRSVFDDLTQEVVDQIWAEAIVHYMMGEELFLPKDIEKMAEERQRDHQILSGKEGIVDQFLEELIPESWYIMSDMSRKQFLQGNLKLPDGEQTVQRDRVTPLEIWVYCFGNQAGKMQRTDTIEIGRIMRNLRGWEPMSGPTRFGNLGTSRGFRRI